MTEFDDWFDEMEGYSFRSERFYDDYDACEIEPVVYWGA